MIPLHAYDRHDRCGSWCRYTAEKEAYEHNTISGGFKDQLFESLVELFNSIAKNVINSRMEPLLRGTRIFITSPLVEPQRQDATD